MRGWLLIHFVSDAGMFGQGVKSGALAGMVGDRRAIRGALLISRELLPVIEARGVDLRRHWRALLPFRFSNLVAAAMAWVTARFPIARVSLAAHTDPHAAEARAILRDAMLAARRFNIAAPRLEASFQSMP